MLHLAALPPLHQAAIDGDVKLVRQLLQEGADLEEKYDRYYEIKEEDELDKALE